jgi:hypothetical protein
MKLLLRLIYISLFTLLVVNTQASSQENQTKNQIIKSIDTIILSIEGFEKKNFKKIKIFEASENNNAVKITQLKQMPEYVPEDSIFMIYVLNDEEGKILKHEVDPTSQSGDWSASFTHYFDKLGRTIMFEFYTGSFNSQCTDILKIRRRYYYDDNFNLIKKSVTYSDKDNKPIKNPDRCETYGIQLEKPKIYKSNKDIEAAINKSTTPYIE